MFSTSGGICFSLKANPHGIKTLHSCTVRAQYRGEAKQASCECLVIWEWLSSRIIQGKKTKEEFLAAQAKVNSTVASASTETASASSQQNNGPGNGHATPADQASSWWIAQREAQKAPATTDTNDQPPTGTEHSDDKATS
jgi:hypothetical protein